MLRCADGCSELALEEWERQRLVRPLQPDLATEHPAHGFCVRASEQGGFGVERG